MMIHLRGRMFAVGAAAALAFSVVGCTASAPAPTPGTTAPATGIQSPTASASTEWGAYGGKDDACSAVAGDILTLALVPKNLALADPGSGVDDIDGTIREAADAAPPAIAPNYQQLSAIVEAYGRELRTWRDAVEQAQATPTPTASAPVSPAASGAPTPRPSSSPGDPERPAFVDTGYTAQLDRIKAWLSDTCG